MKDVIKSILQIDNISSIKEENADILIKDKEKGKNEVLDKMKKEYEDEYNKNICIFDSDEKKEYEKKLQLLNEKYAQENRIINKIFDGFSKKISEDAFNKILRDLEG